MITSSIAFQQLVVKILPFSCQIWKLDLRLHKVFDGQRGADERNLERIKAWPELCRSSASNKKAALEKLLKDEEKLQKLLSSQPPRWKTVSFVKRRASAIRNREQQILHRRERP